MNNNIQLTIVIADDHPIVRQGLIRVIENEPQYKLVGEASNGKEALELIQKYNPDLAVLDIEMPILGGLDVLKTISKTKNKTKFVILTMYNDEEYFNAAMNSGVKGYLLKDSMLIEIIECFEIILQNKHYISPKISEYLIGRKEKEKSFKSSFPSLEKLTKMEIQVLKLLSENMTSKRIADEMFISEKTVENHRASICSKLELKGYNALLSFALKNKSQLENFH